MHITNHEGLHWYNALDTQRRKLLRMERDQRELMIDIWRSELHSLQQKKFEEKYQALQRQDEREKMEEEEIKALQPHSSKVKPPLLSQL